MRININIEEKILKKFSIENLPDFLVITGENGSGKTQLLKILSVENESQDIYENEIFKSISKSEIIENGKKLNNVNFVSNNDEMYGHYHINLGQKITPQTYVNNWGKLPAKYISFLNLKKISPNNISLAELNKRYVNDTGSGNKNSISQSDLNLFLKIYSEKTNKLELATTEECIINLPITSNNNLFSANLTLLYIKHKCKLDLGIKTEETPWDIFNKVLAEANFKYRLHPPDLNSINFNISAQLIDVKSKKIIEIQNLSSGEKTIMSLVLALYNSKNQTTFPDVILLDEPDSALHPSMSKQMIDVLQNVFVKEQNVKVIITTHSPTTVALSPELSIYKMDRDIGKLIKTEKKTAIQSLTKGLDNLNIYYENRKQVFVESNIDKFFYENTYAYLKTQGLLNEKIHLEFITMSETKEKGDINGGCDFVKKIVNGLNKGGNNSTYGLLDSDNGKNNSDKHISILGNGNRYSIENYILDPIFLSFFILREIETKKIEFGFSIEDKITNFSNIKNSSLQRIVNLITKKIEFQSKSELNSEKYSYTTVNGFNIEIPLWYCKMKGHLLEEKILKNLYDLISHKEKNSICKPMIKKSILTIPEFLPVDILDTFKNLESK